MNLKKLYGNYAPFLKKNLADNVKFSKKLTSGLLKSRQHCQRKCILTIMSPRVSK